MGQTTLATWLRKPLDSATATTSKPASEGIDNTDLLLARPSGQNDPNPSSFEEAANARSSQTVPSTIHETSKQTELGTNVGTEPCTQTHLKSFRRLLSLLLPIPYPESFYRETVGDPVISSLTRVALWRDISRWSQVAGDREKATDHTQLVAAIRCRLITDDQQKEDAHSPVLYISALATLSAFRERGVASMLLRAVTKTAVNEYGARSVMAHVWDQNEEALAWYKSRGFEVVGKEEQYYRRLAPHTAAWVIRREVQPSDLLPRADDKG